MKTQKYKVQSTVNGKVLYPSDQKNPVIIRSSSDSELIIEISRESEINILPTITELNFLKYKQTVNVENSPSDKINRTKSIKYIKEYNVTDFIEYNEQLIKEFNLLNVQKTTRIKTKNSTSTPLLLTF